MTHQAGAYPGFCNMKRLGVFLLPLDGMLVHRRVTPSINFVGTEGLLELSVLSKNTTQFPGQGSNPDRSIRCQAY